jgi:rubrerythrin
VISAVKDARIRLLLSEILKDEKEHHEMLMKLEGKTFFITSDFEFKSTEELEERYMKVERKNSSR